MTANMFDLTGKKAIVTGGRSGLGRSMVEGLHKEGAEIVIIDVSEETLQVASELSKEGKPVHAVVGNLLDREERRRVFRESLELLGGTLDILVNNAGMHDRRACLDMPLEAWDKVIELNITAVFDLCKQAGEIMVPRGSGKIISMASMLSFIGGFNASAYAVTKAGIAQLTKSLTNEWAGHGLNINAIAPGYMDTDMNTDLKQDQVRMPQVTARIPAGRWGTPKDLEGIVVFLASEASSYINGAIIPVDGGYLGR